MKSILTIIAVLAIAGCDIPTPGPDTAGDARYASAAWSWSFATHGGQSPAPSPTPSPSGDTCDNCDGRGKLGDGTVSVTCPVCNGTGKRTNQPVAEPDENGDDISATEPVDVPAPPQESCEIVPAGEWYAPVRRGIFGRWRRW